jgi:hypothetical protein
VARASETRSLFVGAVLAATVPIAVAAGRAVAAGWEPTGDNAFSAVRARDVFTTDPPLLGTWSSASLYTHRQINHPGPLQFDLLAIPVRLFGSGPGTALGIAAINAVAIVLLGWLVRRLLGDTAAIIAMAFSALLAWSMGSEMLFDPWSQHAPLLPFALFLVAAWAVFADDLVALPVLAISGSYVLQTHLSYIVLVPTLAAVAVGAQAWRLRRDRESRRAKWLAIGLAAVLLCWAQPLVEQASAMVSGDGEGNMAALWRSRDADAPNPGAGSALRMLGGTVAVPPAWLPPSYGEPSFHLDGSGRPTWLAGLALAALAAALVAAGRRAKQHSEPALAAGTTVALVALAAGYVSIVCAPTRWGATATYVRWMWPLGMVVWLVLAAAAASEPEGRGLARPVLVLAAVAALGASLHTVDHGSGSPRWTVEAADAIGDDVVAALDGHDAVLVRLNIDLASGAAGPALFATLQEAGIEIYVDTPALVRQLGDDREYAPGRADVVVTIRGDTFADVRHPRERRVAAWEGDDGVGARKVTVYMRRLTT